MKTFRGIDHIAIGGVGGLRHGNAGVGNENDLDGGVLAAADATPGIAGTLDPDTEEHEDAEGDVEVDGIEEEALEGELFGSGDGVGHCFYVGSQSVR